MLYTSSRWWRWRSTQEAVEDAKCRHERCRGRIKSRRRYNCIADLPDCQFHLSRGPRGRPAAAPLSGRPRRTIFHPIGAHETRSAPAVRARRAAPCLPPEIAAVSQSPVPCITVVVRSRNENKHNGRPLYRSACACVQQCFECVYRDLYRRSRRLS